ncbi:methionyl-tRNA formyltransferase [Alphaproteobacteria bacterium]|nr:methionyl-tRNA formyltransferase [Alphaproteobacteria bacterium]
MNIVFMGTSDFSLKSLEAMHREKLNIVAVYTQPSKPYGRSLKVRKSLVHEFAENVMQVPVYTPKSLRKPEQLEIFASLKPDLAVVSSYGLIIPQNILDVPTHGFINIHASILPRWRGAAPIQAALLSGDKETGISIMKMDAGIDTGDIISIKSLEITPQTNHGELSEKLGLMGAEMILETIANLDESLANAYKQPESGVTYAAKISKESCRINWSDPAENILRQIKAFSPIPSSWSEINGMRIKILDAELSSEDFSDTPGTIHEKMIVSCGNGCVRLLEVKPEGKNKMKAADFMRGHQCLQHMG